MNAALVISECISRARLRLLLLRYRYWRLVAASGLFLRAINVGVRRAGGLRRVVVGGGGVWLVVVVIVVVSCKRWW